MITLTCEVCGCEFAAQRRRQHPRCGSTCRARASERARQGLPVDFDPDAFWARYGAIAPWGRHEPPRAALSAR